MIDFLYCLLGYAIGIALYSIGILQIILTHKISVKQTKIMQNANVPAHYDKIYKSMFITICIWSYILYIAFGLITYFANKQILIGIAIGLIFSWILSLRSLGFSRDNVEDYQKTYGKYYIISDPNFENFKILLNHDTMLYRWRYVVVLLLLLPSSLISVFLLTYVENGLVLIPTLFLLEPLYFYIRHWNNMFYKSNKNIVQTVKKASNKNPVIILLTTGIIILLGINIFTLYLYNTLLTESKLLIDEVSILETDFKKSDAAKTIENASMNNLLKEIRQYAGSVTSGTNDFKLLRCVMVLDKGSSMQSQIYANFTSTVSAESSNSKINFEFNDDEVDEYLNFKVTGVNLGCSTLTFTNDYNDDTATMLVIVK